MATHSIVYKNTTYLINGSTSIGAIIELSHKLNMEQISLSDFYCKEVNKYITIHNEYLDFTNGYTHSFVLPTDLIPMKNIIDYTSDRYRTTAYIDSNGDIVLKAEKE